MTDFEIKSAQWLDAAHTGAVVQMYMTGLGLVPYTVRRADTERDKLAARVWEALRHVTVQEPAEEPESVKEARARIVRNGYLAGTDVYMLPDYPITDERRAVIMAYRQYLRDLPTDPDWYKKHIMTLKEWEAQA